MKKIFLNATLAFLFALSLSASATEETNKPSNIEKVASEISVEKADVIHKVNSNLDKQKINLASLKTDNRELSSREKELEKSIANLKAKFEKLQEENKQLIAIDREQEASRKTLEGALRLTATQMGERMSKALYASEMGEDAAKLVQIRNERQYPSINEIRFVMDTLLKEMSTSGVIKTGKMPVFSATGKEIQAEVTRFGGLTALAQVDGHLSYLIPIDDGARLMLAPGGRVSDALKSAQEYVSGSTKLVPLDISFGNFFTKIEGDKTLFEHLNAGGNLVWVIVGVGVICALMGLFRLINLMSLKTPTEGTMKEYLEKLGEGKTSDALNVMEKEVSPRNPVAQVLNHMLRENSSSVIGLEKAFDEAESMYLIPLQKSITLVAVGAAVAPLLGLLGTVTGMISTFDVITIFGNGDPKLLSGGISVALITTEIGLVVAIILMLLHYFLTRRLEVVTERVEEYASITIAKACSFLVKSPMEGYENARDTN